ncbi:NUDIX hydrolase [Acetobacter sacchari]|uniref:NUDIX hydrolase n=1 Tax=Acetobacter sacchari TaxID=2661687 RepID=A0ABS3LUK2_9PROT|nr:NUDIX hydrolase [Acetobacter sacchari]
MTEVNEIAPRGAVLAVLRRSDDGAFLLVRRANPPDSGLWGFPGGKIEPGEGMFEAACRELREETGVSAHGRSVITAFDSITRAPSGALLFHYLIAVILCSSDVALADVSLHAGDDALEADWFDTKGIRALGALASARCLEIALAAEPSKPQGI